MFLRVGSATNESTMSLFSTRIKSLHIWGNFSKFMVVEFEDVSTSFCGRKAHLFGSCLFTHDWAFTSNKKGWMGSTTVSDTSKTRLPGHCLGTRSQTESECWKTETQIGTPARVKAETWKFVRQRGSSRALGTRGLYVLWNYYAANSHAATPDVRLGERVS